MLFHCVCSLSGESAASEITSAPPDPAQDEASRRSAFIASLLDREIARREQAAAGRGGEGGGVRLQERREEDGAGEGRPGGRAKGLSAGAKRERERGQCCLKFVPL